MAITASGVPREGMRFSIAILRELTSNQNGGCIVVRYKSSFVQNLRARERHRLLNALIRVVATAATIPRMKKKIYNDITETIGNTPLVRLNRTAVKHGASANILLKLEFFNPLSSVKDRIGLAMIDAGIAGGRILPDTVLIEATSGNTGIALAFVAAAKGLKLILVMPDTMTMERRKILKILGARLVLVPGPEGMKGAMAKAREISASIPNSVILQQFANPANPMIHRTTTAEEIWDDTDGKVDIIVSGVGTGGTITGVGEALKTRKPSLKLVAVEPDGSAVLSGGAAGPHKLHGLGAGFVPEVLNTKIYDEVIRVKDTDSGPVSRDTNQLDGIPVGISSGAAIWAAIQLSKRPDNKDKQIVVIVPSSSERYLSSWLFADVGLDTDSIEDLVKSQAG
jgi:cysteine synthase A